MRVDGDAPSARASVRLLALAMPDAHMPLPARPDARMPLALASVPLAIRATSMQKAPSPLACRKATSKKEPLPGLEKRRQKRAIAKA